MASVINDLRAVLDNRLSGTSGLPDIVYDNVYYDRDNGTNFIEVQFRPTERRPAVRGLNPSHLYSGVYRLLVHTREDQGSGTAFDIADALIDRFESTTDITYNGNYVTIDFAEVSGAVYSDPPFFVVPVEIGWYSYT